MSLLYFDGFDVGDTELLWVWDGTPTLSTVVPFPDAANPGCSLKFESTDYNGIVKRGCTPSSELVIGFNARWNIDALGFGATPIVVLYGDNGATRHVEVLLDSEGTLSLRCGGVVVGSTALGFWPQNVFRFIEVKATVADSGGTCVVRADEAVVFDFVGDTRNGGTSTDLDAYALHVVGFGDAFADIFYDDFYVCDTLGSRNNDFLGIGRAQTCLPNGPGADTALTPVPAAPNWDNVNDVPWSSTDYNYSTTAGDRDLYALADLDSSTVEVAAVQTVLIAHSDDTSARVKAAIRSGGTVYYDADVTLNGSPSAVSVVLREDDPATSAQWTVSGVNALQAGAEIVS